MARVNNMIWGVVLVLTGFIIAVVGLKFSYPVSLILGLVGLGVTVFGYVVFRAGRTAGGAKRRGRARAGAVSGE
jgi:lipopolysaccharide export LptBFGC system permease protein LptF